jgi:hypothetical protein
MKYVLFFLLWLMSSVYSQNIAPGGYYVSGNQILNENGEAHRFKGVNRPSLEWNSRGAFLMESDFAKMASWQANVVRVPLNQKFWLENENEYRTKVDTVISWIQNNGMDVILDLHWSDQGGLLEEAEQQDMADTLSLAFWIDLAQRYKDNGRILFELYNEPRNISWELWHDGGPHPSEDYEIVGMQELYDSVRAAGAHNLILIGGLNWAFDLSGVAEYPIEGYNIAYVTHLYPYGNKMPPYWHDAFGYLAAEHPIIITEFGPNSNTDIKNMEYVQNIADFADSLEISWVAWAWYNFGRNNPFDDFYPAQDAYDVNEYGLWLYEQLTGETLSSLPVPKTGGAYIQNRTLHWSRPVESIEILNLQGRLQVQILPKSGEKSSDLSQFNLSLAYPYLVHLRYYGQGSQWLRIADGKKPHR